MGVYRRWEYIKYPQLTPVSLYGAGYKAEGVGAGISLIPSLEEVPIAHR